VRCFSDYWNRVAQLRAISHLRFVITVRWDSKEWYDNCMLRVRRFWLDPVL
jgi:hypothetical protein